MEREATCDLAEKESLKNKDVLMGLDLSNKRLGLQGVASNDIYIYRTTEPDCVVRSYKNKAIYRTDIREGKQEVMGFNCERLCSRMIGLLRTKWG